MSLLSPLFGTTRFVVRRAAHRLARRVPEVPELRDVVASHVHFPPDAKLVTKEILSARQDEGAEQLTVVFAHGFTLSSRSWVFQAEHLREIPNLRMLLPDLRGHGESTGPAETYTVDTTARDMLEIIGHLAPSGPLLLVGHSLGVQTVLSMMRQADSEFVARVRGIALVNGAIDSFASVGVTQILRSLPVRLMRKYGQRYPRVAARVKGSVDWVLEPFIASFVYHGALEEGESARFDVVEYHAEEIDRCTMTTVLGFMDDLINHDETEAAPRLADIPGVVMVGQKDNVTPASQTRAIVEEWPKATLRDIPETGHMLPLEAPEIVNEELAGLIARVR